MPTDYRNTLIISGNTKEIQLFAQKCKGWDIYYPNSNDDYTREIEIFRKKTNFLKCQTYYKTLPRVEARMKCIKAHDDTEEEIKKKFRPRTEMEIQNAIELNRQIHFSKEPYFCLNVLHPEPEENYDKENWREWRYKNWGCKHARTLEFELSDNNIKISLMAANGCIANWVIKVSKDFPTLLFNLDWDGYIEVGSCVIQNGEILELVENNRT